MRKKDEREGIRECKGFGYFVVMRTIIGDVDVDDCDVADVNYGNSDYISSIYMKNEMAIRIIRVMMITA